MVLKDPQLIALLLDGVGAALLHHIGQPWTRVETRFDPNDSRNATSSPEGLAFTPLAIENGKRAGPREYLLRVQKQFPNNLTIQKHALATRVLFEGTKAVGVEYIDKAHVYRADPAPIDRPDALERCQVLVKREVILAGGAFNSPQLLKLSGVGPRAELEKWGIPLVADVPGVGENLQDRYEVGVISEFSRDFALLSDAKFCPPQAPGETDACLQEWEKGGTGIYASNGSLIGIIKRSSPNLPDPDLYIFGLPGFFRGYVPGYSQAFEYHRNRFTWAILKARTNNTGRVTLASAKPWDTPEINFQYFGDGGRANDPDLNAVVNGVKFVRGMNRRLADLGVIRQEEMPGPDYDSDDKLREFVRNESWGHHASCTNKIGAASDPMAVLDSRFRVRGTQGLRVVDASIFPKIPGYFIVSAIYMASEKASDVVMEDAS
jgi:choline dehydrogenase